MYNLPSLPLLPGKTGRKQKAARLHIHCEFSKETASLRRCNGAGLAANFGLGGMGTDTGNSIRGPAGWNSVVGIRPSLGLTSRYPGPRFRLTLHAKGAVTLTYHARVACISP